MADCGIKPIRFIHIFLGYLKKNEGSMPVNASSTRGREEGIP